MSVSDNAHVSSVSQRSLVAQNPALLRRWRLWVVASVVLSLAMVAGNVALFAVRPARHWPLLETVETLQVASLIPVALLLHQLNQRATLSRLITAIGIGAMVAAMAIDVGFVTELVAFSKGPIGGPSFYIVELVVFGWLLGANALAWSRRSLPRSVALLGMVAAATMTLLYPVWALLLLRDLTPNTRD
jgi:hypothetical protein